MVVLLKQIIDGSINIVEGCRRLVSLNIDEEIRDEDDDFLVIRGFESETDEFPIGCVRKHWQKESLKKMDEDLNKYLEQAKPVLFKACKNLINKYE